MSRVEAFLFNLLLMCHSSAKKDKTVYHEVMHCGWWRNKKRERETVDKCFVLHFMASSVFVLVTEWFLTPLLWLLDVIIAHCWILLPKVLWLSLLTTTQETHTNSSGCWTNQTGSECFYCFGVFFDSRRKSLSVFCIYRPHGLAPRQVFEEHEPIRTALNCSQRWWLLYESKNASACSKNRFGSARAITSHRIYIFWFSECR